MRITTAFLLISALHVSATGIGQTVSYSGKNVPLEKVFSAIRQQTGFVFFYKLPDLEGTRPVTVDWKNIPLETALEKLTQLQSLSFSIEGNTIFIHHQAAAQPVRPPENPAPAPAGTDIKGRILNDKGEPLAGASVTIKGSKNGASTDADGNFILKNVPPGATLVISFTGFESREVRPGDRTTINVTLLRTNSPLDEVQIIAYGSTTRRLNTGDVSSVTAEQIARQPVSNVLGALEGLAPGLSVVQSDGLAGGSFRVSIRGQNSLQSDANPLYVVDGVPFTNTSVGQFPGTNYESSPLNTISPGDIERIDILKDADATAIYGSRGADGVILITTKKGKAGKPGLSINAYAGISNATRLMKWLSTPQYLQMRREAFRNDSITPDIFNAPDLLVWDTTRNIDWQKLLLGGTAHTQEFQTALTGGSGKTQFRVSATYHHETPVYGNSEYATQDYGYRRGAVAFNLSHASSDNKFRMGLSAQYTADKSNYSAAAFSEVPLPPDAPQPFSAPGKLNWSEGGASFSNPFGQLASAFNLNNNLLMTSTDLSYALLPGLTLKVNMGFNKLENGVVSTTPVAAQDPSQNPHSYASIVSNQQSSWSVEPQLEYIRQTAIGKFDLLSGATWQDQSTQGLRNNLSDYSSDIFVGTLTGAAYTTTTNSSSDYRYNAFYGRLTYNLDDEYLLNFTGRRDGSSRFGPGRQFANFGAVGAGWIFTKESWFKDHAGWLSFGKLRGSYGITGSDNIGNYQFVDTWWATTGETYGGAGGFTPANLYNPDYAWETNKKLEAGLELGFLKDRILLGTSVYRNHSGNQLINYSLPNQTGFYSVLENFPAVVQNSGVEVTLNAAPVRTKKFQWNLTFNVSANRNKLITFPGLDSSSYASSYVIGQPTTIQKYFQYQGINPQTGIYTFNGTNWSTDRIAIKDAYGPPRFFGGLENRLVYGGWELSLFFQFEKAYGQGYAARMAGYGAPGTMYNQPVYVLDRWQKPGDRTSVQRYTTSGAAYDAYDTYGNSSDASIVSTSFIRFKNVSLAYNFPAPLLNHLKIQHIRVYLQGQNLAIFTGYKGGDPESQGIGNPLTRVCTGGIQFIF